MMLKLLPQGLLLTACAMLTSGTTTAAADSGVGCAIDVCFAVDQSGSIQSDYSKIQDSVKAFVDVFSNDGSTFIMPGKGSLVAFGDKATLKQPLTNLTKQVKDAAAATTFGSTALYDGAGLCLNTLQGSSSNVPKVVIVISDGIDNASQTWTASSIKAAVTGTPMTYLFAAAIGSVPSLPTLTALTGGKADRVFQATSPADLKKKAAGFAKLICGEVPHTPAETCESAAAECDFYFNGFKSSIPTYNLCANSPDNGPGFTDGIKARNGDTIGVMNNRAVTAEYFKSGVGFTSLTALHSRLTPTQLKPFYDWPKRVARVGHETFQEGSRLPLANQCIRVLFTNWQVLKSDGTTVERNVNLDKATKTSCAVFKVGNTNCRRGLRGALVGSEQTS